MLAKFIAPDEKNISVLRQIGIVLYGNSRPDIMKWNTPLWFLPCLFSVLVLVYFIEVLASKTGGERKRTIQVAFVIVSFFIGILMKKTVDIRLPLQLESGIFMLGFTELGVIFKQSGFTSKVSRINKVALVLIILLCVVAGCVVSNINGFSEVRIYAYGQQPILFIVSSLLLGTAVIMVAVLTKCNTMLQLIGKNTLIILCLHKFPVVFFQSICPVIKNILKKTETVSGMICAVVVSIAIMFMCYVAQCIINIGINCIHNYINGKE